MNYLAPIRLVLVPIYLIHPDPRTLLVIQNVVFWWVDSGGLHAGPRRVAERGHRCSAAALVR